MNPLLLEFPTEFHTERLHIRMPYPGDGQKVHHAKLASMKELRPWMPFAQEEGTEEETEANIREAYVNFLKREDLRFLAFLKDTGELVVSTGLHRINWKVPKFEIGYWVDTRHSGKGYVSEAAQGLADYAFEQLKARRVEIRCDALNEKSRAVAERIGFRLEGILRNDSLSVTGDELRDTCIFAKTK
ncbi:GNAT family N-acetyltransferase [Bacillus horti]|uniref:RimJ/RimL family protein N-acetyltransferase n=1 Tax=Caldalkalibacillus horti TaxID=77523 RepID=A0ABT9VY92_9BACI|nr:GNAT family N-acetyltransferase [Bacillus horti]MDQ0165968.1 RimJ/RimL family protein N-acetyltransferase [Bacillus horti]